MVREPPFSMLRPDRTGDVGFQHPGFQPAAHGGIATIVASACAAVKGATDAGEAVDQEDHVLAAFQFALDVLEDHSVSSTCSSALWSLVLATISASGTARRKWVTSSGRSSISRAMARQSGQSALMALTICSSSTVLPALGGATIS